IGSLCDLKVIHTHRGGYLASDDQLLEKYAKKKVSTELGEVDRKFFGVSVLEDLISLTLLNPFVFNLFSKYLIMILTRMNGSNVEKITSGQGLKVLGFRLFKSFFQSNQVKKDRGFPDFLLYRYTNLQASIGLRRLEKIRKIEQMRISNARLLISKLSAVAIENLPFNYTLNGGVFWKFPIWLKDAESFKKTAFDHGIDCSQTNLPNLYEIEIGDGRNMRDNVVYLPVHWYLKPRDVERIAYV